MLEAMKGLAPVWYVLEAEHDDEGNPVENATAFQLAPLSGPDMADCVAEMSDPGRASRMKGLVTAARKGVINWKNLKDPTTGREMKFNAYNMKHLRAEWLFELGGKVLEISELPEDGKKN